MPAFWARYLIELCDQRVSDCMDAKLVKGQNSVVVNGCALGWRDQCIKENTLEGSRFQRMQDI